MIEESVEALIYLKDKMDLPAFIVALNVKFLKVAEAAKAERDKEILEMLPEKGNPVYFKNCYPPNSRYKEGWDECLSQVKALINNQKKV